MKILVNEHISEVIVREKLKYYNDLWYSTYLKKEGKILGIFPKYTTKKGLCYRWSGNYWGEIEEYNTKDRNMYFEFDGTDGVFYYKPHCAIIMSSGKEYVHYFETVEELKEYVEKLVVEVPHITLK